MKYAKREEIAKRNNLVRDSSFLITGVAGYIGSYVVKLILENSNDDITVIDNISTGFKSTIDELKKIGDFNSYMRI